MKKNRISILCAAALLMSAMAGCGQQSSQAEYIGIDAAKAIALESAGVSKATASFSTAGLDQKNGMNFYAVDFTANGQSYEYDIDAVTGVVISSNTPEAVDQGSTGGVEISSMTTQTATAQQNTASASQNASTGNTPAITESRAKEIALKAAGLTGDQVTFLKSNLDYDNGQQYYDVEFYTSDYAEYDYEINASTGDVISYDLDAEGYTPPTSGSATITADKAKQIALEKVPGAKVSDIYEFELDRDDGRLEYEGTIYYSGVEYEFTIDGYSGAIRGWETEHRNR